MQKWSLGSLVPRPLPDWPGDKASPLVDPITAAQIEPAPQQLPLFSYPAEPSSLIKHYPTTSIVFLLWLSF